MRNRTTRFRAFADSSRRIPFVLKGVHVCDTVIALAVFCSGCAHPPGTFRLTAPGNTTKLIPPGVKDLTVERAAIRLAPIPKKKSCDPSPHGLLVERKALAGPRAVVTRPGIDSTTPAELFAWTLALERQGCIPANETFRLAADIIDALPLDLAKRNQLTQGRSDLTSVNSLRVVSPVLQPGASGPLAEVTSVSQGKNPGSLDVSVKANPAVIGYEIDWYDFAAREDGPGYRIVPRSAEIHIGDSVERSATPTIHRFQFEPMAHWYELYMMTKVSANDFDFVVFSARTSNELQSSVAAFQRDAAEFLKTAAPDSYNVLPHGSGINAYIRVKVNGVLLDLPKGDTVRQAIGERAGDPAKAFQKLTVRKLHDGRLYPVKWDHSTDQILSLPLEGGEEIEW